MNVSVLMQISAFTAQVFSPWGLTLLGAMSDFSGSLTDHPGSHEAHTFRVPHGNDEL